jgi:glucose-1-phosphate thymidylyltransferase
VKGIVLAGGSGTRLRPLTSVVCKQLLPVYDKPMIYYPVATQMLAGIREMLIISTPQDLPRLRDLLGSGEAWGVRFEYMAQPKPEGIAQAFTLGRTFVGSSSVCLVLGDNIFHGEGLGRLLQGAAVDRPGATVFGYYVSDPERYGVVETDKQGRVLSIEEKPASPRGNHAVTGLYFYDNQVLDIAANLKPSARGELEITDVNCEYLRRGQLNVQLLGRGLAWLDTGTPEALMEAAKFIEILEQRTGLKVCAPEEIAYRMKFIDLQQLGKLAEEMKTSAYGAYLRRIASEEAR